MALARPHGWAIEFSPSVALPATDIPDLTMLYTLALILVLLWAVGLATSVTAGGLIHLLLVIAIVVVLLRVISGRRVL